MTDVATQITLGQYMSKGTLGPLVRKKLFGGYEVPLGPCLINVSTWLFQKGAILGRARFDRLDVLVKLLSCDPEREEDACSELRRVAKKRLDNFGREPHSFHTYWWETEFSTFDFTDSNVLKSLSVKKVCLEEIASSVDYWLYSGIAFGATYPQLVAKIWIQTYETSKPNEWAMAREQYGLDIPEEQTLLPLDEMEQGVLLEVGRYVFDFFPQLMEPLGLKMT